MSVYPHKGVSLWYKLYQFLHCRKQDAHQLAFGVLLAILLILPAFPPLLAAQSPPSITAKAALLIDAKTQKVFFARNPSLRLPMASTTKVMTALVVLEKGRLEEKVRISSRAVKTPASKIYLKEGETISTEDLLYATLLHSANDASVALAEAIGDSESNFARMMTQRAHILGAKDTRFANASGLPAPNHYSTVHDLALLMKYAINNPHFVQIARTKKHVLDRRQGLKRHVRNHNKLLWQFAGAGSGKTGYTRAAGHCYVGIATRNGRTLIVVVLKSRSLWRDVHRLLEYGFHLLNYQPDTLQVALRDKQEKTASTGEGAQSTEEASFYTLQIGAFRDKESAKSLRDRLKRAGHQPYILESNLSDGVWYRVRIGTYADIDEARAFAQNLQEEVIILPHEDP